MPDTTKDAVFIAGSGFARRIPWRISVKERRRYAGADKVTETEELRQRLNNANTYFKRMAADVFGDEDSVRLLAELYQKTAIRLSEFDSGRQGIALSRLAAAHFCEVGANLIYITEAGQRFIEWLD